MATFSGLIKHFFLKNPDTFYQIKYLKNNYTGITLSLFSQLYFDKKKLITR